MSEVITRAEALEHRLSKADGSLLAAMDKHHPHLRDLLHKLQRDARARAAQMEAVSNYQWAGESAYQTRIAQTRERLIKYSVELDRMWPGARMAIDGDPRGFVVRVLPPNGHGDCWAGGVGVA